MKINNILFPTDFSRCANQALSHALYLAKHYRAKLYMLHALILHESDPFYPTYHFPNSEELNDRLQSLSKTQMEKDLQNFSFDDLSIEKIQRNGVSVASVIFEVIDDLSIDLVVMGTHGRRGLGHLLLGSAAEEVVRSAPCPVLTVREKKSPTPLERIDRIMVPIDFSTHSQTALAYAEKIARVYNAQLQLVHVVEDRVHPSFYLTGKQSIFEFMPEIKSRSEQQIEKMCRQANCSDVPSDIFIIEGMASRDLIKFAEENQTDLIVISTHGLSGIEHFFLGSIAEKVVRRSPCPVFTVKSFGKSLIEL